MEDLEGKEDGGWKNVEWKKMKDGRCRGERGEGWKIERMMIGRHSVIKITRINELRLVR